MAYTTPMWRLDSSCLKTGRKCLLKQPLSFCFHLSPSLLTLLSHFFSLYSAYTRIEILKTAAWWQLTNILCPIKVNNPNPATRNGSIRISSFSNLLVCQRTRSLDQGNHPEHEHEHNRDGHWLYKRLAGCPFTMEANNIILQCVGLSC